MSHFPALKRIWDTIEELRNKKNPDQSLPRPDTGNKGTQRSGHTSKKNISASKARSSDETSAMDALASTSNLLNQIFGDIIQFNMTTSSEVTYIGNLSRSFLREDIRSLIFRHGSNPKGEWIMVAQVSNIPDPNQAIQSRRELEQLWSSLDPSKIKTGALVFDLILRAYNNLQEVISSVAYPDVAVAPIAIYRETHSLR